MLADYGSGAVVTVGDHSPIRVPSVEEAVYSCLRNEILCLRLAPGEGLPLDGIARRYGVSLTPVRHALRSLESEGLVLSVRRRGSRVAPLTTEELAEIQSIRLGVEGVLARYGAPRCTKSTLAELGRIRKQMDVAYESGDLNAYIATLWDFRNPCYRLAGHPRVLEIAERMRIRVERYIFLLCQGLGAFGEVREFHDRFLDACRDHDGEAAEEVTREGIVWVWRRIESMTGDAGLPLTAGVWTE